MTKETLDFVTFSIGSVAEKLGVSAVLVYRWFKSTAIINSYIIPAYDVLHTFSREYIANDLIDLLQKKGIKIC